MATEAGASDGRADMEAMAWWLIPIVATLLAVAWVTWRARPRRPADAHESLAAHRRFTEALSPPADQQATRPQDAEETDDLSTQHRRSA
jgi:hypothetical protein